MVLSKSKDNLKSNVYFCLVVYHKCFPMKMVAKLHCILAELAPDRRKLGPRDFTEAKNIGDIIRIFCEYTDINRYYT